MYMCIYIYIKLYPIMRPNQNHVYTLPYRKRKWAL